MIKEIENTLTSLVEKKITEKYGIELQEKFLFEMPADRKWGDLSCRVAFVLPKILKKAPLQIAKEISEFFTEEALIRKIEIAGNGFINLYFDRKKYIERFIKAFNEKQTFTESKKIIVEHTNINPNKAAHIGHIRNACLGDTLTRLLRFLHCSVEVQNYIDDTGVQLADVVVGFINIDKKNLEEVKTISEKLDYYCWNLYGKVNLWYEENSLNKEKRYEVLKAIEEGNNEISTLAHYIAENMAKAHLHTMHRLNITYDLLTRESDIIKLKFWETAFTSLKEKKAVHYETEGKFSGCWIMPLSDNPELANLSEPDKILVRSNGTLTYVAKDIAYQLWKFGLLTTNFYYEIFHHYPDGQPVWRSTTTDNPISTAPQFGNAGKVYNVIDVRQSYLQKIVAESLKMLGYTEQAQNSVHFAYEIVALSHKSCKEMNLPTEDTEDKEFIGMSGRKGIGIKADDFIDAIEKRSYDEILTRNASIETEDAHHISRLIATAAIRYYMLKYSRNKILIFDMEDALNFDGETGPYLQYTSVRANNILKKFQDKGFIVPPLDNLPEYPDASFYTDEFEAIWDLFCNCSLIHRIAVKSLDNLELSLFAKHIYVLAQKFNYFYYHYDVIHMPEQERNFRAFIVNFFKHQFNTALSLIGIPIPTKM